MRDRFKGRYVVEPTSGCWLWLRSVDRNGYGQLIVAGRKVAAHRWSYAYFKGTIPEGACVMHTCDVPACVNPGHLVLGSHRDNMTDRDRKGRVLRGSASGASKLDEAAVRLIRALASNGASKASLAREFDVSATHVARIVRRAVWRHI